jgi:hypothetical protein
VIGIPVYKIYYKAPTCSDRIKNGDELDVDCGGSCQLLCQSAFLPPRIEWGGAKIEKISDGLYNVGSYIVNPNINGGATSAKYKMSLYDSAGVFITERTGNLTIYPRRNTLAFQPSVDTGKRIPTKATFELISPPVWFKSSDVLGGLAIVDRKYSEDQNTSSLEVVLENKNLEPYNNLLVSAVLYDEAGNTIGFSQTRIDYISGGGREVAPYTWPVNRGGKVAKIEVLPIIIPILER